MKTKTHIALLLIMFAINNKAQTNLVPNPSFEDTLQCPYTTGYLPVTDWTVFSPSPDYYNSCANGKSNPLAGVPSNWEGYQNAYDGNAYVGIATYLVGSTEREYIGVQLTNQLIIGTKYYVSAYISRADSLTCACNNFGFRFTNIHYNDSINWASISNYAQVYSTNIITDSLNWTKISGSFIADSTYKYVMLGNFFDDAHTDTLHRCYDPGTMAAYYYIDMVCISTDSLTCNQTLGIDNKVNMLPQITVYPNPVVDYININSSYKNYDLEIYNVLGEETLHLNNNISKTTINTSVLTNGFYILKIKTSTTENSYKIYINH